VARVLVVDDNHDTCELLARVLRRMGHDATCQTSARSALEYLRAETPDLIVLDVMMPGMKGLELLKKVRADARTAAVTVVIFSALSDEKTRAEARRLGANGYVIKGTGWAELHTEIQNHIGPGPSRADSADTGAGEEA
jgi:DNA-binding response OmpR family regulator